MFANTNACTQACVTTYIHTYRHTNMGDSCMTDREMLMLVCQKHSYIQIHASIMSVYIYRYIVTWKHACLHLCMSGYTHAYSFLHVCIHTSICSCIQHIYICIDTYMQTHIDICIQKQAYVQIQMCVHALVQKSMPAYTYTYLHTSICLSSYIHKYLHAICMHAPIHVWLHTYIIYIDSCINTHI